ncbi:MAG: hypothetical protein LUQ40_01500, partial [Methanomicrobiales archaeon]|nr:hypothetical protein [Methanomicrobiales archaeon]
MSNRLTVLSFAMVMVMLAVVILSAGCSSSVQQPSDTVKGVTFLPPKNVSHFMDMMPPAGATFPGVPLNVVVDVDSNLSDVSTMTIQQNGKEYGTTLAIDENRVTLRKYMSQAAPDGLYTVNYTACWESGVPCENGMFQFAINRSLSAGYVDWRGKPDVIIHIEKSGAKNPQYVIVSPGTNMTWVNDDSSPHTADSDSHMTH